MRIHDYLDQIQHAVETIIAVLHVEHDRADQARKELRRLTQATQAGYAHAESASMLAADLDDEPLLGPSISWETYFGPDKERFQKEQQLSGLEETLLARELSAGALAGSLLQYAKQGIALRYGRFRVGCPEGRSIGPASLSDVVWNARNQAMHWEEGSFNSHVEACFDKLASEVDPAFGAYRIRSMAYEIVTLLGWRAFADFSRDLSSLDP